ncbi:MAG: NUDIX hydrolase [Alphaproteobacteria bacterium]|nr:NUDIX hydrolase [Alphaproteobacteria bacterium]
MSETLRAKGPIVERVPEGDTRARLVCEDCGFIRYENPKIVVGAVCAWEDRVLLCRRAIVPRRGYWTIPAGYLELNESPAAGAAREAREEAEAEIAIDALLAVYAVPRISQVQLIYRARLISPAVKPGIESEDAALFGWDAIPWRELAFPSVHWALDDFRATAGLAAFAPRGNPPGATGDRMPDGGAAWRRE